MAKKFLTGLKLVNLSSDPASGEEGELYFNTTASVAKIYKQGAWSELGSGAGGGSTITVSTTAPVSPSEGDEWYKNDTGELYIWDGTYWVEVNGTISASGVLTNIDSIAYPDYITFDTTPEIIPTEQGSIYWDSGDGIPKTILNANVELGIGQEQVALVKNATGSSISKGKVVYINGAQGQRPTIALSDADAESTSSKTFGLTAETIADGAEGFVTTFGVLRGVNTNGLTQGAALWLSSTAGGYTTTIPTDPAHLVFIGYVVKAHASSGEIFVNPQNGYELNELHDVLINGVAQDNVIRYDATSGLWKNENPFTITAYNKTESTINAFIPVYFDVETASTSEVCIAPADSDELTYLSKMPSGGITTASVAHTSSTKVVTFGPVRGMNLTGYTDGDILYVASGGGLTNTKPTGNDAIQPFARVLSVENGTIFVYGNYFYAHTSTLPNLASNKIWLGSSGRPAETTLDTSIVTENSNLYFTDERAQDAAASMITGGSHTGMSVEYVDSSNIFNFTNTGVTALYGTTNEIEVSSSTGGVTVGLPNQVVINDQLTIGGTDKGNIVLKNASGTTALELQADASGSGSILAGTELGISVTNGPISISAASGSIVLTATNGEYLNSALSTNQIATQGWVDTNYLTQSNAASTYQPLGNYAIDTHNHTLDSLSNVVITGTPTDGQAIVWDTATSKWVNEAVVSDLSNYVTLSGTQTLSNKSISESLLFLDSTASTRFTIWNDEENDKATISALGGIAIYGEGNVSLTSGAGDIYINPDNVLYVTNPTTSSSSTTGAIVVTGGVGIGEDLYVNNDVYIGGNINITGSISGSLTYVDVTNLVVTDPLIYLAESNPNDSVDIGIFAALNHGGPSYEHTGLIRDASDSGKWKLVSGLDDPTANVIDFTGATYDILKIGALEVTDSSTTRANLGLVIGNDIQAYSSTLAAVAGGTYSGDDSITTVGTVSSGTWEGTKVDATHGGTNQSSWTTGDILYASATNTLSKLAATTDGYVLTLASGVPTWAAASGGGGGLSTTTTSITTNSATVIESFGTSTSRTAEAIIQITQGTDYYSSKALFIHDGTNVKITEYAILESTVGAIPVTISAAINGSNVELSATITDAATTNATAKVILIEVAV